MDHKLYKYNNSSHTHSGFPEAPIFSLLIKNLSLTSRDKMSFIKLVSSPDLIL